MSGHWVFESSYVPATLWGVSGATQPVASRRRVLLAVAGLGAFAGCSRLTDPVVHGTNPAGGAPVAEPEPRWVEAASQVQACRAAALASPAGSWRSVAIALLDRHLGVVTAPHPLDGHPSPSPWITPSASTPPGDAAASAAEAIAGHRSRCVAAAPGAEAMLWAAMTVATECLERSRTGTGALATNVPRGGGRPGQITLGSAVQTQNLLLGHLHKLAQLLELGVGAAEGAAEAPFSRRLDQVRREVTQAQARIRQLKGDPVAPLPGYRYPSPVTTPAQISQAWTTVEADLVNAWGPVVGSAAASDRAALLQAMSAQAALAQGRGGPVGAFPGWV